MDTVAGKRIWLWATDVAPVRVRALLAAGRADEAGSLVAAFGRGLRARGLGADEAPGPWAALITCRALMAEARGRPARAATLFGQAAQAWRVPPRPYAAVLAQERQAGCLVAAGQPEAGLELLFRVYQDLSSLGARGDAERVKQALQRNGMPVRRAGRPSYGDQLSPRELDVVRLLATGQTNREIARALSLSPRTVASHIDSAMRKHRAPSRTALLMSAVEAGMVPVARPAPDR
jgi:DNA-binding CsgD family transcriptional regulator